MNPFDKELRESLQRREPPPGFADRVLNRARQLDSRPKHFFSWRWAAATAAAVLVLATGSLGYREYSRRAEGERAKEQVMLALRLTGSELRGVQDRLARAQRRVIEVPE
ncbi:MAG TPA: hypothetical protein VE422_04315 [Terriglobia bacterium]|nr:hypothetical protein [Terriglobia bacterium]